jgi:hypothetical protein
MSEAKDDSVHVTVSSPFGNPIPKNGVIKLSKGPQTFKVDATAEETEKKEFLGKYRKKKWNCTGWSNGSGDIPKTGVGNSAEFDIQHDSTITWNWTRSYIWSQILSILAIVFFIILAVVSIYVWRHAFLVAISAGAIGGLAHEIGQSGGKYVLPTTDDTGNFCLGGLIGIIAGGTAGVTTYQGLLGTASTAVVAPDARLVVAALLAGLAIKGVADAANPKSSSSSTSS